MISIADLNDLMNNPQVAYDGYDELRAAARRRNGGFADPADIPRTNEVIQRRGVDWCQSVIGKPMFGGQGSISMADADMLLVADVRDLDPPMPAWLVQWKAESAGLQRRQDEARAAGRRRDRERWAAALAACGAEVEVRPNVNGRRYGTGMNDGPLRHVVPLADVRSSRRRHPAGRPLCEVNHARTLGEPTDEPATCVSCIEYTAEIQPVRSPSMNTPAELNIIQHQLDRTDLVVLVGHDGLVEWSAKRPTEQVVAMLRSIADSIEDGTL